MVVSKKELERIQSLISKAGVVSLQLVFKDLVEGSEGRSRF
jgi:hypothetical protein